ncbi:MAG: cobalamin-dependent protein [Nitrospiraceae bacterium]|nr:MAG: cobalamin-dependent protein [Nitrospiraceae bacterium]
MDVLLVNPNRYKSPPVPPIGLEHVSAYLVEQGHKTVVVDCCFVENIPAALDSAINAFSPDIAGITIRNIDSVLLQNNEFFLDEIKDMVNYLKEHWGLPVIIGGTGVWTNPEGVMEYLNADYVVSGSAEESLLTCLNSIEDGNQEKRYFKEYGTGTIYCPRNSDLTDYRKYSDANGIAGFQTHKGCSSSCVYCIEAHTRVRFKHIKDTIREIRCLTEGGYHHFHLCDSEFNEDLDFAADFCASLNKSTLKITWTAYMKPANYNKKLFRLMKETGVYLITLTVDSFRKCPEYQADIEKMIFISQSCGIKMSIDFLTGFPYESEDDIIQWFDFFRRLQPERVNVNTSIRLYKILPITGIIMNDSALRKYLVGYTGDDTLVKPVFYNHIDSARLTDLIAGDRLFRIEGIEPGVNYTRLVQSS